LSSVIDAIHSAVKKTGVHPSEIASVGLANQGETVIAFDRESGKPVYPAISWLDKRNADFAARLAADGCTGSIRDTTGLLPDPYFSAFKMKWILDNIPDAADLVMKDRLCLATSDSWLLRQLTGQRRPVTDYATASRTMLLNLRTLEWSPEMLELFEIPLNALPELIGNSGDAGDGGTLEKSILGAEIPVEGLCVDQQAALFGQLCLQRGDTKATFGTGCFVLANQGTDSFEITDGLLSSVGWRTLGSTTYVYDGGIYTAGSLLQWLIEKVQVSSSIADINNIIGRAQSPGEVLFIPALGGLAAPYWISNAAGSWTGLTADTSREDLVYSAVESICFRVRDVVETMRSTGLGIRQLQVDGGISKSPEIMRLQADILGIPVAVFDSHEATAYGAGLFAGMARDVWQLDGLPKPNAPARIISPSTANLQEERYRAWRKQLNLQIGA
ncbi:MAG: glycerol kinase, partial [Spirochaetales bacterium]|nr:glycerol kinase [Spirochaetales bacterium]